MTVVSVLSVKPNVVFRVEYLNQRFVQQQMTRYFLSHYAKNQIVPRVDIDKVLQKWGLKRVAGPHRCIFSFFAVLMDQTQKYVRHITCRHISRNIDTYEYEILRNFHSVEWYLSQLENIANPGDLVAMKALSRLKRTNIFFFTRSGVFCLFEKNYFKRKIAIVMDEQGIWAVTPFK